MSLIKCHSCVFALLVIILQNGLVYSSNYTIFKTTTSLVNNLTTNLEKNNNIIDDYLVRNLILSFICIPIIVATLVGNMLVILAVIIVRKLHTQDNASNFLIVSLALSDFLVGILVMPFAFYVEISQENKWHLGSYLCDLWTISDVLLCTASILNLCAISIDRYFIILHSFKYTQKRNKKLMFLMIIIVWLTSALISIPPLFGWGRKQKDQECAVSDDLKYQIYATMLAFYVPSFLMIIVYVNIYRAANKIKKREMQTAGRLHLANFNNNIYNNNNKSNCSTINLKNQSNKTSTIFKDSRADTLFNLQSIDSKSTNKKSESNPILSNETSHATTTFLTNTKQVKNGSYFNINNSSSSGNLANRLGRRVTQALLNIKCSQSSNSPASKNQKATLTLGVIMGCFIFCWLPFFILAILKPIRISNEQKLSALIPKWLDSFLLWLGYLNSALNPLIYARFNREFRRPFIEILCFRCKNINEKLRDEERRKVWLSMNSNHSNLIPHLNANQSTSFNSINHLNPQTEPLLACLSDDTLRSELPKRNSTIIDSTIEIETIKEKSFTIKLNELTNDDNKPSYIHLNETNKSTQVALTNDISAVVANDSSSNLNKYDSIHSLFEQLLNSETNSDKSRLSITMSSLNSFKTLPQTTEHISPVANTIVLTTTQTTLTTELNNNIKNTNSSIFQDISQLELNLKHNQSDLEFKQIASMSSSQRSKTSKKRKLHSNYSKLVSDNNFKKYSKNIHHHHNQRLAYCTYNSLNNKKLPKRICMSPSIISRITTYANLNSSNKNSKLNQLNSPSYESSPSSENTTTTTTSSSSSSSSSSEYYNSNASSTNDYHDQSIKLNHHHHHQLNNSNASYLNFKNSPNIISSENFV